MAAEQGGGTKSAEGLGWLAGYVRAQRRNVGTARVRFGVPLSLRQALADAGEGSTQLEKVAFRICVGHQPRLAGDRDLARDASRC